MQRLGPLRKRRSGREQRVCNKAVASQGYMTKSWGGPDWEAYLGIDPESGHPIHAVSTYFGYKFVLGDVDQPVKSMSVSAASGPKVPTLEEALQMLMFPRVYPHSFHFIES